MKKPTLLLLLGAALTLASSSFAAPDSDFHIYLCFGQSNMEGGGRIEERDRTVNRRFQVLSDFDVPARERKMGQWSDAIPPLTRRTRGISLVDYFGRTMVANLPQKSRGGVVKLARIAQRDGVIKGILIHQGESNFEDMDWPKKVKKIYDDLMKDVNLKPEDVPLFAGEVVNKDHQGVKANANEIMKLLPSVLPNSHVVSSAGCSCHPDKLHFNSAGSREFGKRYGEKMLSVLGYKVAQTR